MGQNIFVGLMAVAALVAGFLGWWFESGRSLKDDDEAKPDTEDTDKKAATTADDRKNPTIMDSAKKAATAMISEEKSHSL